MSSFGAKKNKKQYKEEQKNKDLRSRYRKKAENTI